MVCLLETRLTPNSHYEISGCINNNSATIDHMKKLDNIYDRKLIIDALKSTQTDIERNAICTLVDSFDNTFSSSNKRSVECLTDIIRTNRGYHDPLSLFKKYKESKDQYEKIIIRHGIGADLELKEKYKTRPKPQLFSIYDVQYWMQIRGLNYEEANNKVSSYQLKNSKSRHLKASKESYKNIPHCIEYWINNGYSLEESIAAKNEYNSKHARSYENMIRKYGEELGIKNIKDSQNKRKLTLLERYEITAFGCNSSKAALKAFLPLYKKCRKLGIAKDDICWGIKGSREFATHCQGKNYFYDFTIKSLKIAIEFNGCYWHAREDLEWRRRDILKEDSLKNDRQKIEALEKRGFLVFTIWEDCDIISEIDKLYNKIKEKYEYDKFRRAVSA